MNRFSFLGLFLIPAIGATVFVGSANAQQKLVKDQLVGTWLLVSCTGANGGGMPPFCANPNGRLMMDASGRYVNVVAARGRPKLAAVPGGRAARSAEDYKSAAMGLVANFGTWTLNEADQTLTAHIEAALFPQNEGTDAKFSVSLTGDELKFVDADGAISISRRAR